MLVLTIRSDKPEAEIGLFDDKNKLQYTTWEADRKLGVTIHQKIEEVLNSQSKSLKDLEGIVGFEGPGSFTGLRIGLTVANTLAQQLQIPIAGSTGENWIETGVHDLKTLQRVELKIALPKYGRGAHITTPKK
ncbi:MAG: tRNA (adenosine(37)-N6)-threonylcarbamoyltransferase complex dimerization subunit type 1 TsaB [bacterium]|nr:tRNA (adenosine(37)-N6)-threonylcarbamoyltransferase complex dimerization subunit type 1 TsaB [bacterium]